MAAEDEDRLDVVLLKKKKAEHQLDLIEFPFYSTISSTRLLLNFFPLYIRKIKIVPDLFLYTS